MAYIYQLEQFETNPKSYSHLYYCYRKVFDGQTKQKLMLFENIHFQMIKTAWFYQDQDVARQKLIWWYEELKNTFNGSPQHPISKQLNQIDLTNNQQKLIIEMSECALAFVIYDSQVDSYEVLVSHLINYFYAFEKLKVSCFTDNDLEANIKPIAEIIALVHYIYFLPELLKRDLLLPTDNYLDHYNVTLAQLKQYKLSDGITCWLNSLNEQIQKIHKTLKSQLSLKSKKQLKPLMVNLNLWLKLLKETKKNNYDLFNTQIQLSPIQMLLQSI
ncbi:hypothetical protein L3V83_03675 [Thiotrichales bacterium 19X7-9]|nr:hypothetical protein [Thiotrichales bacterium 19X7-9]